MTVPARPLVAILVAVAAGTASAAWVPDGLPDEAPAPVMAGTMRINGTPGRFAYYGSGLDGPACAGRATRAGWRPVRGSPRALPGHAGILRVARFSRDGAQLWFAWPARGDAWLAAAGCDREPPSSADGDVAGREPGGVPKPPRARRFLHLLGERIEAAWYRAPFRPEAFVAATAARWEAAGWSIALQTPVQLGAARPGEASVGLFAEEAPEGGTVAFVLSGVRP